MARKRTERMLVTHVSAGHRGRRPDELIVEEPMTIQLDGTIVSTTMRTPGNDFDLAVGFCVTEGLLAGVPVTGVRYCAPLEVPDDAVPVGATTSAPVWRTTVDQRSGPDQGSALATAFNVVTVETDGRAPVPTARLGTTSSSCGWCGSEQIDDLLERLSPLPVTTPIDDAVLASMPPLALNGQGLFNSTGAVHAAAAFDRHGNVLLTREDVGRHNAVDKVVGAMHLAGGLPATGHGLFVSGRASVEMVQKAWAAGFGALVAVSAPTALAVQAARRAGMTLLGFVRADSYNVYAP